MSKICLCLAIGSVILSVTAAVLPASGRTRHTFSDSDTGSLIIRYSDLSDSESPVSGSTFDVEQVASLKASVSADGEVSLIRESLVFDRNGNPVVIGEETAASEIEEAVKEARKEGRAGGHHTVLATDADGLARADGMPPGIYLVRETRPASGYLSSKPFLVSIPRTTLQDGEAGWEFEVKVFPKPGKEPEEPSSGVPAGNARTGDDYAPMWVVLCGMLLTGLLAFSACFAGRKRI